MAHSRGLYARWLRFIFSAVPSLTSTDKSVCATLILPNLDEWLLPAEAGVAQTLLSVFGKMQ
jgi:hypothetical protein